MALPICIEIPELPDPFSITLPGGVTMESINLMVQIQPALTPLVPGHRPGLPRQDREGPADLPDRGQPGHRGPLGHSSAPGQLGGRYAPCA